MSSIRSPKGRNGKDQCHRPNGTILYSLALAVLAMALLGSSQGVHASTLRDSSDTFNILAGTGVQIPASTLRNQQDHSRRALKQLIVPAIGNIITPLPVATVAPVVPITTVEPTVPVVPATAVASVVPQTTAAGVAAAATISASAATSKGVGDAVISGVGASAISGSAPVSSVVTAIPGSPPPVAVQGLVVTTTFLAGGPIPMIVPNVPQKTYWKAASPAVAPATSSPLPVTVVQPLLSRVPPKSPPPPPPTRSPPPRLINSPPPKAAVKAPTAMQFSANETVLHAEVKLSGTQLAPFDQSQQVGLLKAMASTLLITSRTMAITKVVVQKGSSSSRRSLLELKPRSLSLPFPSTIEQEAEQLDERPYDLDLMSDSEVDAHFRITAAITGGLRRNLMTASSLDTVKVILVLSAGSASKVSVLKAHLQEAVASGTLKSSMSAQGLQVKTLTLSLATAVVPSAESIKCLQQSSGYCTAAGSPSTPSGLSLGDITAIVLAVIAVLVMLIGGAILLHRRRHARACEPVSDQDFKVLPLDTPMTQNPASRWRSLSAGKQPAGEDDKPLPMPWSLEGSVPQATSLGEDRRTRLMLSARSTAIREGTAYIAPSISPTKASKLDLENSHDLRRVELIAAAHTLQSPLPNPNTAGYNGGVSPNPARGTPQGLPQAIRWAGVSQIIVDSPYAPQHSVRSRHSTTPTPSEDKDSEEGSPSPTVVQLSPHQWVDSVKGAAARWFVNRDA